MQLFSETDIDTDIYELGLALGGEFRKSRIDQLRQRVADLERQHKNAEVARYQLIQAMRDQLEWEMAA